MARLQVMSLPDATYAVVLDDTRTLTLQELDDVEQAASLLKDLLGARALVVFGSTVDVV